MQVEKTPEYTPDYQLDMPREMAGGRIQPQATELEEAVLGAMLIDERAPGQVMDILSKESFYREANGEVFDTMAHLFREGESIDLLTVSAALRKRGHLKSVGGDAYLAKLSQKVSSSAHCEHHARIIAEKHIQRSLIRIGSEIVQSAFDETKDVLDLLDESEEKLFNVTNGNIKKNYESAQSLVEQAIRRIEEIGKREGFSGIPSGFKGIDEITSGWQPSDLVIIAARPGMGKTAFVLSMARNIAVEHKRPTAVFSLEMSSVQLITRLISSETRLESDTLRKGKLTDDEWQRLTNHVEQLENAPLYIDDTPSLSVFDLRAKCRRLVSEKKVEVIIIDYLQLMTGGATKSSGNREQEISQISRSLKSIAKELKVPVIALSQLSREVEKRPSKRPMLSDLRESGAIEQDADIVSFIFRPEYYKMDTWENGESCIGQAEFIIAKHRNGSLDDVRMNFEASVARFSDFRPLSEYSISGADGAMHTIYESRMNAEDSGADGTDAYNSGAIDPQDSPF
jgi:replicative DNA helicase